MEKDLNQRFDELLRLYTRTLENTCLNQLKKAKNKGFAHDKVLNQINGITRFHNAAISKHNKAFQFFYEKYSSGEDLEKIITKIKADFPESLKIVPEIDPRENVELILFGKEENALLNEFPAKTQNLIKFFVGYFSLEEIRKRIPGYLDQIKTGENSSVKYPFKWTGDKDNKNEFVQVIYGLHKAGLINEGKGEITKIVEAIATVFDVKLGENWQSNHSASIHRANSDYQPLIFRKIREAYQQYIGNQIENKKKNKNK
jgi:hypothetical protein